MCRLLVACLLALSTLATALPQEPLIIRRGDERFLLYSNDAGNAVLKPLGDLRVVEWNGETPDDPDDPDPKPEPNEVAKQVADWAKEVNDADGAQKLAVVVSTVRKAVSDGDLDFTDAFPAIKLAADKVLDDSWDGFREKLSGLNTKLAQEGRLDTEDEVLNYLQSIVRGLNIASE